MGKLTNLGGTKASVLSSRLSSPFSICIRPKLYNGYTFSELNPHQLREWQRFLDIASQLTFEQAERRYRRVSDTSDTYQGEQVIHYGIGETFRIHGVIENGQFVLLRLDPKHSVHK